MDSLAGYIASLCVGAAGTYLSQFLRPKVKIRYWLAHSFMYTIPNTQLPAPNPAPALPPGGAGAGNVAAPAVAPPAAPPNLLLLTQALTIQNFGRESAAWVEIVLTRKPDYFQLYPTLNYTENTAATGEYTLRIQSLARKEFFTIQFLCYTHAPQLALIRSNAGQASPMPWLTVRKYPKWFYALMWLVLIVGAGFFAYWIIKGGIFVFKSVMS
jgi:hypothetical protein